GTETGWDIYYLTDKQLVHTENEYIYTADVYTHGSTREVLTGGPDGWKRYDSTFNILGSGPDETYSVKNSDRGYMIGGLGGWFYDGVESDSGPEVTWDVDIRKIGSEINQLYRFVRGGPDGWDARTKIGISAYADCSGTEYATNVGLISISGISIGAQTGLYTVNPTTCAKLRLTNDAVNQVDDDVYGSDTAFQAYTTSSLDTLFTDKRTIVAQRGGVGGGVWGWMYRDVWQPRAIHPVGACIIEGTPPEPSIELHEPPDGATLPCTNDVTFKFTPYDDVSANLECTGFLNNFELLYDSAVPVDIEYRHDQTITDNLLLEGHGAAMYTVDAGYVYSSSPTADGGLIILSRNENISEYTFAIIRVGPDSEIQWETTYEGYDRIATDIIETSDGGIVVVGYEPGSPCPNGRWLAKFFPNGVLDWERDIGSGGYLFDGIVETSDGDFVISGSLCSNPGWGIMIWKLDSNGDDIWSTGNNIPDCEAMFCSRTGYRELIELSDGGYASSAYFEGAQQAVVKFDAAGEYEWDVTGWNLNYMAIAETSDGNIAFLTRGPSPGNMHSLKIIDFSGTVLNDFAWDDGLVATDLLATDEGYIIWGAKDGDYRVRKLNMLGETVYEKAINLPEGQGAQTIDWSDSDSFYVTGVSYNDPADETDYHIDAFKISEGAGCYDWYITCVD
ncbi:MAG: hypothetical protein KKF44_09335, partial [Nanoarchaeota archaeon]|nr:hypothetical protein [Nanoarchaeota archaeon]